MKFLSNRIYQFLILLLSLGLSGNVFSQRADITISTGTQSGGAYTGTAPNRVWVPSASTCVINIATLVTELNTNNVTINTAFGGGNGSGNVQIDGAITTAGTSIVARTFTINAGGTILVKEAITLTRTTAGTGTAGRPGMSLVLNAVSNITTEKSISTVGGTAGGGGGGIGGNGGNISLNSSAGFIFTKETFSTNGGTSTSNGGNPNPGANAGSITFNGATGITIDMVAITANGSAGSGTNQAGGNGGNIIVCTKATDVTAAANLGQKAATFSAAGGAGSGTGVAGTGGTLIKDSTGTFLLSAASQINTFSAINVNRGTLQFNSTAGAFVPATSAVTVNSGATLNLGAQNRTVGSIAGGGNITSTGTPTLTCGGDNTSTTFSGVYGPNALVLTKTGTGTLTITGTNTNTGVTDITGGSISIGNGGAAGALGGTGTVTVTSPGNLTFDRSDNVTFARVIAGTGTVTKNGTGTLTLSVTNTFSSTTTINAGTLSIAADNNLGAAPGAATAGRLVLNGGVLNTSATITLSANRGISLGASGGTINTATGTTLTYAGIAAGTGALTKSGAGTLTVSGVSTYTGRTTLSEGVLNTNNAAAIGTGAFTISAGTTINNSTAAAITLSSDRAVDLNGSFTFTGSQPLNFGAGATTLGADLTVTTTASTLTIGGVVTGATRNLTKAGAGALAFGANAVSVNNLVIDAGTLTASSVTTTLAGNFTNNATFTNNNGTLLFAGTTAQTIGGSVATTFQSLSITNSTGVRALNNMTVNGTLNLGAADLANVGLLNMIAAVGTYASQRYSTLNGDSILPVNLYNTSTGFNNSTNSRNNLNSFVLNLGASATVTGAGSVTGKIRRSTIVNSTTYTFGSANMQMTFTQVAASALPTQITFLHTIGDSAGLHADKLDAVKRMYQVLRTGGTAATTVTLRLPYNQTELNGNTAEGSLVMWDHHLPYNAVTPHEHGKTGNDVTNNWVQLAGHSLFYFASEGDTTFTKYWMISKQESLIPTWIGAASGAGAGDWNNPSNWSSGSVPPADSAVLIPTMGTASNMPILPAAITFRGLEIQSNIEINGGNSVITVTGGAGENGGRGSWINAGNFKPGNSTVVFTSPTATISGDTKFNKLTINNGSTTSINNGTTVEVENTLIANGTLNTNNNLVLKSFSTGTANIGTSTGAITGLVTVERHISANRRFRLLAHPFSTVQSLSILADSIDFTGNVDGITNNNAKTVGAGFTPTVTNNPNAFWFNPALADGNTIDGGWRAFTTANGTGTGNAWGVGQGIRVLVRGKKGQGLDVNAYTPDTVVFNTVGTVNTGNVNLTLNIGGTGTSSGFNLVGNPYPSPVDLSAVVFASAGVNNIQKTIYVRNPTTGAWVSQLLVSGTPFVLPAYTAAFIRNIGSVSVTLPFSEVRKANVSTVTTFKKGSVSNTLIVDLKLGDVVYDNFNVQFSDASTVAFDNGLDAFKLGNDSFNFHAITANNISVCTDVRPAVLGTVVPLCTNIRSGKTAVNFSVNTLEMEKGKLVFLNDTKMGNKIQLATGTQYTFDIDAKDTTTFGLNRFFLSLETDANGVAELQQNMGYVAYPNPATDVVTIAKSNLYAQEVSSIELIDMQGKVLETKDSNFAQTNSISFNVNALNAGVYFLKLNGNGASQILRFVK